MLQIQLVQTVKLIFEPDGIRYLPKLIEAVGSKHPLLLCDPGIVKAGILEKVKKVLDEAKIPYAIFDSVMPDPKAAMVEEAFHFCHSNHCDSVIGIGGGSVIDTSKAVNLLLHNGGHILDYTNLRIIQDSPGLIAIPTTAGTGSELSDGLIISTDNGEKIPILASNAGCEYALIDPTLMLGLPPHVTASTGMDVLAHAMESYTSVSSNPVSDTICEKVIELVLEYLPVAVHNGNDLQARSQMAIASTLAGWMLRYGHTHAGHSIAHVIGSSFHIPHGFACSYALPEIIAFNASAVPEKTVHLGRLLNIPNLDFKTAGRQIRETLIAFRNSIGIRPATSFWSDEVDLSIVAESIVNETFQVFNPRKMSVQDALNLLNLIFK